MQFHNQEADLFIPDQCLLPEALGRSTHLAIVAHQDDTEIMAAHGILECFGRDDAWFSSVIVTNGAGSPRSGIYEACSDEEMLQIRRQEQKKAAFIGDYAAQFQLAWPSAAVKDSVETGVIDELVTILEATSPEIVYLHNPADKHDTHVACMLRAIAALRKMPAEQRPGKVYGCEVWRDLDWLQDNEKLALPVNTHSNLSAALLGVFDSQICGGKRYDLAAAGRRLANATFFASHGVDEVDALSYAMDLTPLIRDTNLDPATFALAAIERFKDDVSAKFAKLS